MTDLAASIACLNDSTVPMSGLGAPLRTATPSPEPAISTHVSGKILPDLTRSSIARRVTITTSNAGAVFDLPLDNIGRVITERELVSRSALKLRAEFAQYLQRSMCAEDF